MSALLERALVPFRGRNATDVLINGLHYNKTALTYFNYTLWSNGTLSNATNCYLVFEEFKPIFLSNGTWINATSCDSPVLGIRGRAAGGIAVAVLFGFSIVITLINLGKHGRLYLPAEKRFRAVGRRWQWYWLIIVGVVGCISGFMSIDVDRDYLPGSALILNNIFYYCLLPTTLAATWESVRHWGSWQERQQVDVDAWVFQQDDTRSKIEFYQPLVFYLFDFLNFFLTILRSWTPIGHQGSHELIRTEAKPAATDARFKAASFLAVCALAVIVFGLRQAIHSYRTPHYGCWPSFNGFIHYTPLKFLLVIPFLLVKVAYDVACAFEFSISPLKLDSSPGYLYVLGYGPVFAVVTKFEIYGFIKENEDRVLLRTRRERDRSLDHELLEMERKRRSGAPPNPNPRGAPTTEVGSIASKDTTLVAESSLRSEAASNLGVINEDGTRGQYRIRSMLDA
jgi:hypothetical protein